MTVTMALFRIWVAALLETASGFRMMPHPAHILSATRNERPSVTWTTRCFPCRSVWLGAGTVQDLLGINSLPRVSSLCARVDDAWRNLDEGDDNDDDVSEVSGRSNAKDIDWREFRAKLVIQQHQERKREQVGGEDQFPSKGIVGEQQEEKTSSSSSWAYDAGTVIERGSIILSRPEQDFGFGLEQQYFHKCVILVLYHEEKVFTKAVILNRPTDLVLSDEDFVNDDGSPLDGSDASNRWRVWFGGDVRGIDSDDTPEIICLHSLSSERAREVSEEIVKDIQWTSFENARKLVNSGMARTSDFWVFIGYAGWDPGQLAGELERESWYMVAADSRTLLEQLAKLGGENGLGNGLIVDTAQGGTAIIDPRDAGLETWKMLMDKIGRGDEAGATAWDEGFDDLMLKEWARERLVYGSVVENEKASVDSAAFALLDAIDSSPMEETNSRNLEAMLSFAKVGIDNIHVGSLVRGSSAERSPFLLGDQEFHKCIILITHDDDNLTAGVLLNHPSKEGVEFHVRGESAIVAGRPKRYGGRYGFIGEDEKPLMWLHCSEPLRLKKIGKPIGDIHHPDGIWKCTEKQAKCAVEKGMASSCDFMLVSGFCVWEKVLQGELGGMRSEVLGGNFELVEKSAMLSVWETLQTQSILSSSSLDWNLNVGNSAWIKAGTKHEDLSPSLNSYKMKRGTLEGSSEHITNNDRSRMKNEAIYVHKSGVKVSDLAEDALRSWVATVLLEEPSLRNRIFQ